MYSTPEAAAASVLTACAAAIIIPYGVGRLGGPIAPALVLLLAIVAAAAMLLWLLRGSSRLDLLAFTSIVAGVATALLWLAWPALLPTGGGSDLTHHLQLVDFIER